jgi:stress response protein YsnF
MGRMVETAPEIRTESDVTILPVVEEVLVVEKRLVLKEELHIRRRVRQLTQAPC